MFDGDDSVGDGHSVEIQLDKVAGHDLLNCVQRLSRDGLQVAWLHDGHGYTCGAILSKQLAVQLHRIASSGDEEVDLTWLFSYPTLSETLSAEDISFYDPP